MRVHTTAWVLAVLTLCLIIFGIFMLDSAGAAFATINYRDPHYYLKRQLIWVLIALAVGIVVLRVDYHLLKKYALVLWIIAVFLLVAVLIVGYEIKGARRWFRISEFSFQPSEAAKLCCITAICAWLAKYREKISSFTHGFLIPLVIVAIPAVLILREPDVGNSALILLSGMTVMFFAGSRIIYLLVAGLLAGIGLTMVLWLDPARWARVLALLYPEMVPNTAYQLEQAKKAFASGGLWGRGYLNSIQKYFFLPEAHNDFILPIIGEEMGLVGTMFVILMFVGILVCGLLIAFRTRDNFGKLFAFGITVTLILQVVINIGVVSGCLPTKGLPLPFISYGGSSFLMSLTSICILMNIASRIEPEPHELERKSIARDMVFRP